MLAGDGPGVVLGAEMEQVDEIAMRGGGGRLQFHGATITLERFGQTPLVLQRVSQVAVHFGRLRGHGQCPAETLDRFPGTILRAQRGAQVVQGRQVIGRQFQGPSIAGLGVGQASQVLGGVAPPEPGVGPSRLKLQRTAVPVEGLRQLAERVKRGGEIVANAGQVRLKLERLSIAGDRLRPPALGAQQVAQVMVGLGQVGLHDDCPAEASGGPVEFVQGPGGNAQVIVILGPVGPLPDGLLVAGQGFGQVALAPVGFASRVVEVALRGVGFDREVDVFQGAPVVALLEGGHPGHVQGVGMARLGGQDPAVDLLGQVEPTGLVVRHGDRKGFGNRGHRAEGEEEAGRGPTWAGSSILPHPDAQRNTAPFKIGASCR